LTDIAKDFTHQRKKEAKEPTERVKALVGGTMPSIYKKEDFEDIPRDNRTVWLNKFKLKFGCFKCGYKNCAEVLHFHHNSNKDKNVSMLLKAPRWKMVKEICNCSILCANCHIELHKDLT